MTKLKKLVALIFILTLSGCDDLNLGMRYQSKLINQNAGTTIYCYHISWALDAQAFFISANKDLCMGFDSTKDFCFGGQTDVYYETKNDTLKLYSNSKPFFPKHFPRTVTMTELDIVETMNYEEKFRKGEIDKIVFDTVMHDSPCKMVPYSKFNNMQFEKGK